jgi:RNA polymerase sigma factor (sigma-70 family)
MIEFDTIDTSGYIRSKLKDYIHMSPDEEEATIAIMQSSKYSRKIREAARNKLLKSHIRLIFGVAFVYAKRYGKVVGDMFQAAYLGMVNATTKYDPSRGVKFTSFAIWWITQKIQEEIYVENCSVHFPMYTKAEAEKHKLMPELKAEDDKGRKCMHAMPSVMSIDTPIHEGGTSDGDSMSLLDTIKSDYRDIEKIYTEEEDRKLGVILKGLLSSADYKLIKDAYYYGMNQTQMGEQMRISGEAVRRKRNRAQEMAKKILSKLRAENKFSYTNTIQECNIHRVFEV